MNKVFLTIAENNKETLFKKEGCVCEKGMQKHKKRQKGDFPDSCSRSDSLPAYWL